MEYASILKGNPLMVNGALANKDYMRYTGYDDSNGCNREYFSKETVRLISRKVTELTLGVDPQNRPIIVPDETIAGIMSEVNYSYRPATGDIFSRYTMVSDEPENMVSNMINQVINIIVTDVKVNLETEQNNQKLTVWTSVLGEGVNAHGLRSHDVLKINNKKPKSFQFNMNY